MFYHFLYVYGLCVCNKELLLLNFLIPDSILAYYYNFVRYENVGFDSINFDIKNNLHLCLSKIKIVFFHK